MALRAAFPSGPVADSSGNLAPAWRGFFQSLYSRTGDVNGVSTSGLFAAIAAETTARTNADNGLSGQMATETAARQTADAAEAAARANADAALSLQKVSKSGDTMTGPLSVPMVSGSLAQFATFQSRSGGPTWTSGVGDPAGAVAASGSLFSRTDGAVGTRLYVSQGAGAWLAVAGV